MALVSVSNTNVSMYNHLRHLPNPSLGGSNISMNTIRTKVHGATYLFSYYRNSSFRRVQVNNSYDSELGSSLPTAGFPTVSTTSPTSLTSGQPEGSFIRSKSFKNGAYTLTIECDIPYSSNEFYEFYGWYTGSGATGTYLHGTNPYSFSTGAYTGTYNWYSYVLISEICTPAGTKISMAEGPDKNVEDLVVGDVVKSANVPGAPNTDLNNFRPIELFDWDSGVTSHESWTDWTLTTANVTQVEAHSAEELLTINDGQLQCTPGHIMMMYTQRPDGSRGWCMRRASTLNVGDHLLQQNGTGVLVSKIDKTVATEENPITVYKVNVENDDFYWTNGFMSHNAK